MEQLNTKIKSLKLIMTKAMNRLEKDLNVFKKTRIETGASSQSQEEGYRDIRDPRKARKEKERFREYY